MKFMHIDLLELLDTEDEEDEKKEEALIASKETTLPSEKKEL